MEQIRRKQPQYRALFVDDEANVLKALTRVLRPLRNSWEIHFATDGQEALDLMGCQAFDLVVSDMRMPGMDGARLLEKVREISPRTVRVILSGQSEQRVVLKTVLHAHQFLGKPTDADEIRQLMERVANLIRLLHNECVRGLVTGIESLPSMPDYHARLIRTIESEDATIKDIADLVAKDMGMAGNLLKLVNSSFFGHPRPVAELTEAVWWLGLELLKSLALTVGIFSAFRGPAELEDYINELMRHSLATGNIAKRICLEETRNRAEAELAFLGGLMHDVGKLVLASQSPGPYLQALETVKVGDDSLCEVETRMYGTTHAEVGGYFAGLWGMSLAAVEAIAFHHRPQGVSPQGFCTLMAVHVANGLENNLALPEDQRTWRDIDRGFLEAHNKGDALDRWVRLLTEQA